MVDSIAQRFADAFNSYDGAVVADLFAVDGTHEDLGMGHLCKGRDAIEAFVTHGGSDFYLHLLSEHASEDRYTIEWETEGTHTSSLGGLAPTNLPFRFRGASIGRLDGDGKIVENRDYWNLADLLRQVGLLLTPDA
jgi:steroid delta-isomerase-like uncharacterized protein